MPSRRHDTGWRDDELDALESRLQTLGLSTEESRVYTALGSEGVTTQDLSARTGLSRPRVTAALGALGTKGLVNRLPGKTTRFAIAPPDWVLPGLIRQREEALVEAREVVEDLLRRHRQKGRSSVPPAEYVEVATGIDAVIAQVDRVRSAARKEIVGFVKGPVLAPTTLENPAVVQGIVNRYLWDREFLESPGVMEVARDYARAGEEIRVAPDLPSKIVIADRRWATVQVTERREGDTLVAGVVTRHPELVATLYRLFTVLWSRGIPLFEFSSTGYGGGKDPSERDRLVQLLAAGMSDVAIARHLGVSRRTLTRRIQSLLDGLGVQTRFQAGLKIARGAEELEDA